MQVDLRNGDRSVTVGASDVVLMGVINRSPESANRDVFADSPQAAVEMAGRYRAAGVGVIDVGGQSTNFENPDIGVDEELRRLIPTVEALAAAGHIVSVDTWKAEVVAAVAEAGAALINETAGLNDPQVVDAVAASGLPTVLMYLEGDNPNDAAGYDSRNAKNEQIADRLGRRLATLSEAGVREVIVDPGIAISYRTDYTAYSMVQFDVARNLGVLSDLGRPVLYAVPRKEDRHRNVALAALAMHAGADMLRIHDVEMIADVAKLMGRLPMEAS